MTVNIKKCEGESKDNSIFEAYEPVEWDRVWIDHATDKKTKRILYIGDSISDATRKELAKLCGEHYFVDSFKVKAVDTTEYR